MFNIVYIVLNEDFGYFTGRYSTKTARLRPVTFTAIQFRQIVTPVHKPNQVQSIDRCRKPIHFATKSLKRVPFDDTFAILTTIHTRKESPLTTPPQSLLLSILEKSPL